MTNSTASRCRQRVADRAMGAAGGGRARYTGRCNEPKARLGPEWMLEALGFKHGKPMIIRFMHAITAVVAGLGSLYSYRAYRCKYGVDLGRKPGCRRSFRAGRRAKLAANP